MSEAKEIETLDHVLGAMGSPDTLDNHRWQYLAIALREICLAQGIDLELKLMQEERE